MSACMMWRKRLTRDAGKLVYVDERGQKIAWHVLRHGIIYAACLMRVHQYVDTLSEVVFLLCGVRDERPRGQVSVKPSGKVMSAEGEGEGER